MNFKKMHALGNDMVILNAHLPNDAAHFVQKIACRKTGIGFDQLMTVESYQGEQNALSVEIWNCDGSKALSCGNGMRCVIHVFSVANEEITLHAPDGTVLYGRCVAINDVCLTQPWPNVGFIQMPNGLHRHAKIDLSHWGLRSGIPVHAINPHLIVEIDQLDDIVLHDLGNELSQHFLFPHGVNVSFVEKESFRVFLYERGAGPTHACGSASVAIGSVYLPQVSEKKINITMPGGILSVYASHDAAYITHQGPVEQVFSGKLVHPPQIFKR